MTNFEIDYAAEQLGPNGPGFVVCPTIIPKSVSQRIGEELGDPDVSWYPQYNQFENARNIIVNQAFDVFAHKYIRGDQEDVASKPALHSLAKYVSEQVVDPLTDAFPSLKTWLPDEISAQRYEHFTGHLSWHRDLERHPGIVAICNVVGRATLTLRHREDVSQATLGPGDILVLRAPDLFDKQLLAPDEDIRPEHAVLLAEGDPNRISATIRANTRPAEPIPNFHYHNWQS